MAPSVDGRRVRLKRSLPRSSLAILPIATAIVCLGHPAGAIDLRLFDGALSGSFDTTVTLGAALRTQDRNDSFIGVVNGGHQPFGFTCQRCKPLDRALRGDGRGDQDALHAAFI